MPYDLDLLHEYCREIGLDARRADAMRLDILLGEGAVLVLANGEREEDCLIGFAGTPWHTHGDELWFSGRGYHVELDLLAVLGGIAKGEVLVCDEEIGGKLADRWLVHKDHNDEFGYLAPGERLIVRRAACAGSAGPGQAPDGGR